MGQLSTCKLFFFFFFYIGLKAQVIKPFRCSSAVRSTAAAEGRAWGYLDDVSVTGLTQGRVEMGHGRAGLAPALLHTLLLRTSWPTEGIWYMSLNTDLVLPVWEKAVTP